MTDIHCLRHVGLSHDFGFNRHSEYYAGLVTEADYKCLHIYSNSTYVRVVTRILKVNQPYGAHVRAVDLLCRSDEYKHELP